MIKHLQKKTLNLIYWTFTIIFICSLAMTKIEFEILFAVYIFVTGSVCQANILKYGIRANKKHDNPKDDIQKIIRYSEFWLNDLDGKPASSPRVEEIATIDKIKDMLNSQEKELIQEKKIKCVVINNDEIPEHVAQDIIRELWRIADEKQKI